MKRYLAISIDVEPDCSDNWQYSNPLSFTGVTSGIGDRLQPLFEKYGLAPTYLINNVVLEDEASVNFFKNLQGSFELGTHLHPEFIEPQKKFDNYAGKSGRANCCFYPPDIERAKIKSITELFQNAFGYRPTSFRAGRYSAGPNTITTLADLGYKVDSSVSPHICWNDSTREHPVDYTQAPEQPYFIREGTILEMNPNGRLLQVPITIGLIKRNFIRELISSAGGLKHPFRHFKQIWLRPYYSTAEQMKHIIDLFTEKYKKKDILVFNMMFHNVEVMPGLSPYSSTEEDCKQYLEQLDKFFSFCREQCIEGTRLSDLYNVFRK